MERLACILFFALISQLNASPSAFCADDCPSIGELEGQLDSLQDAMKSFLSRDERCHCGCRDCGCEGITPPTDPPTTPPPDECELTGEIYDVVSAFPEVEYDDGFTDPESSLFLETEKELIECLEEVLDELLGKICIDVTSIREADPGTGIEVDFKLTSDGSQTHDEINEVIANNTKAPLCSNFKYVAFYSFQVRYSNATWAVVSDTRPEHYRVTVPLCEPWNDEFKDPESPRYTDKARTIVNGITRAFAGVPGTQAARVEEFWSVGTAPDISALALVVVESRAFYELAVIQTILKNMVSGIGVSSCSELEDFTITYWPIPRHQLRLTEGNVPSNGRAEIFRNDEWRSICSTKWRVSEWPTLFCGEYGYPGAIGAAQVVDVNITSGTAGPAIKNTRCSPANKRSIFKCQRSADLPNCNHAADMAVNCQKLVRLAGGPRVIEGRVEFFNGNKWGTVCSNSITPPNNDFAEVLCSELGYSGVDTVEWARDYNEIGVGKGNITFMNPKCNLDTTKSMQDCGLRPDLEDCNHSNDVYVKCTGPVTNVPRLLDAPIYGAITCRSEMVAWADGSHLVTRRSHYRTAALIEMPTDTQVLAVKCSKTSIGGLLATLSNGFRSDRNWMCTTRNVSEENWKQAGYDDSNWETPAEVADLGESPYGNVKGIDDPKAKWLWVHWREAYRIDMYCRLWFNRETTVYFANGPLPSIGVMGFLETQRGVHDYKFYSPNWPSVACRESGYQWAQGSEYSSVAEISSLSNSPSLRRPDFCPGIEDGYMSECIPFNEYDQNSYDVAINCRPRVELIGGNAREGILRIYKRYEWGTVCDYDPTTARYKRVCLELGYPEIESVRVEDGSGIDAEEQVAMHNIQCINDTVSIMDCTSDPLFNVCGHDKDVYIECRGGQEGVHESLVPTSVKASCGSHSKVDVYTDGLLIRSTSEHAYTDMAKDTEVIGVHCVWDDDDDDDDDDDTSKDLTVELGNGIVSNDRWQCSNKRWDHWSSMHFNPRSYSAARELQKDSVFPFPIHAKRIRAADNEDSNELFCRRQLADYFRVTLVFTDHEYTSALSNSSTRAYQMMEELYIPKLTTLFTSTFGTQTVQIEGFDIGLDNEITRRRKRSTIGLMVKWIIRSVNYDNEGELYKVVKDAIDSGNIDGLTPQLEHFTFVRLDMTYMLLRLVDGPQDHIGRVEVYKHGIWGSVCDHEEWVTDFGELFCHTRKYPRTNSHYVTGLTQAVNANIPIGTTPHTIINPHGCKSYSQSPYECIRHPIGEPDHDNDLAINCRRKVRLGFSEKKREGKLEMYDGENWGSVCVHSLENVDFGDVACKELGYPEGAKAVLYAKNEMGRRAADSDHLALQNPACDPMTTRAMETCGSNRDELSCDQQKNVFLKCKGQPESTPRDLRFPIQGQVTCDSIVEVWADGKLFLRRESWKLIHYVEIPAYTRTLAIKCISKSYQGGIIAHFGSRVQSDDTWNCFTENLAEGEEGLKGEDFSDSNYDASSWIKSHKLGVSGDSERWAGYPLEFVDEYPEIEWMWGKEKQGHTTVICRKNFVIKADVRLQDGIHPYHGRVEVNKHGTWGSVCETELQTGGWPSLVCIELGFPGIKSAAYANNETGIQQGVGDIAIKSPNCDQFTANSLGQCLGTPDQLCLHDLDVVIECHPKIRLVDGPTDKEGLVQVFIDGEWGYITDRRKPLFDNYPWVHLACKDAGFGRASAAISVQDMRRSGTPRAPMNAHNPTCSDDATSFDDCPNDPNLYSNPLSKVIYLTCTPPPGGSGGGVGFPFTPGKVSCRGTLKVYADGAIMFNSELSGPFDLVHFTLPTDFKKLSVQCIPIDSHLDINFSLDSKPEGQWRCLHAEVPEPIWTHLNFDQSSWPHANVTDVNATAFILAPTEKRDPFLPVSCSIIVNDEPVPPFNITSPAGCDSLTKYLPDMWSKCKYRECVYGRSPWVTLDGELSVMVRRTPCPANMTVPDTFEPGDTMPCTVPGKLCAECPSYPLYHRHPDSRCQYLKCESTPYVDPEGRTRYVAKEYTCPSTKGIPKNFIEGIITPCSKYRDECAPDDPEPEPTQGDCTDSETNGVIHETEWLSGCAVITSQEYDPNMDNQGSDIFQTTASDVIGALENTLCNVPANIDIRILDIIEFEGVGINVKWHMQVTMTPGMDIAQIHQEIQEAVANGEIIHYRPDSTYVRFAVMGGGCNITLETVNYILTTNIDLPFLPEYLTQTPEYLDLATRYAAAIDALYDAEGVASDRVTRVTAVRPHTIPVLNGSKDIIQIEVDMASETEETHDEMKKVFSDAVESDMIGEFPIAHHVNYTNI